jgi:hypothetical protein
LHKEIAIHDFSIGSEPSVHTGQVSEDPEESRIGVSGDGRLVQVEIAIRDFPIGSGPSIGEDAWHEILASRGIGVFEGKEIVQQEIAIRDFPTRSEPSVHTGQVSGIRRKSQIGKSGSLRTRNSGHRKSRNPESQSGPSTCMDRWQPSRNHRRLAPSGNRESRGHDV